VTLVLALPAVDGLVIASDGQVTAGAIRWTEPKIRQLNEHALWSAAGELALIQRVEETIVSLPREQPLPVLRDQLALIVMQSVSALIGLDFRTPFAQNNPLLLLQLHAGDFVFAECRDEPRILHITLNGTPEWINVPFATGVGADFGYALLQRYRGLTLSLDAASLLAYKTIEEAIEVGAYGLGPPIDVWHIAKGGKSRKLDEPEIAALVDASRTLREAERLLFRTVGDGRGKPDNPESVR
jgi:proteasome beta subunit